MKPMGSAGTARVWGFSSRDYASSAFPDEPAQCSPAVPPHPCPMGRWPTFRPPNRHTLQRDDAEVLVGGDERHGVADDRAASLALEHEGRAGIRRRDIACGPVRMRGGHIWIARGVMCFRGGHGGLSSMCANHRRGHASCGPRRALHRDLLLLHPLQGHHSTAADLIVPTALPSLGHAANRGALGEGKATRVFLL